MLINQITYSLLLLLFFIGLNCFLKRVGYHAFEPGRVFLYPWILMSALLFLGPIQFEDDLSIKTLSIIILFSILFVLGTVASKVRGFRIIKLVKIKPFEVKDFSSLVRVLILIGSIIFVAVGLYEIFEYLLKAESRTFAEQRAEHWGKLYEKNSGVRERLIEISKPFAVLFMTASAYYYVNKRYYSFSFSLFLLLLIAFVGVVLSAGRFEIFFIFACMFYYAIFIGYFQSIAFRKKVYFSIAAFLLGIYFILIFSIQRNPDLLGNELYYLSRLDNAKYSVYIEYLYAEIGITWVKAFAYNLSYFISPIPKFDLFIRSSDISSYYSMGQYNFPHISRLLNLIEVAGYEWAEIRMRVADFLSSYGLSTNPWATGYRDLIIDFGISFSALFCFIFGYFSQFSFYKAMRTKKNEYLIVSVLLVTSCTVFPFLSPFFISVFMFSILLGLFMALILSRVTLTKRPS